MKYYFKPFLYICIFTFLIVIVAYVSLLDSRVTNKLDGVLWTVPAKVYSRPLELAEGSRINLNNLTRELDLLSYEKIKTNPKSPGEYSLKDNNLSIFIRGFDDQVPGLFTLDIKNGEIKGIKRRDGISLDLIKLEPLSIGGMYPAHNQDRILLNWSQVPDDLVQIILLVEDKNFFNHRGLSFKSIFRAFLRNTRSLSIEEGGSTITQQLAKSLFFSPRQTLRRKMKEALAAILIELHYSKQEILLAYINDVFIAQSGKRAIHGFGLASQFFFGTSLENLDTEQMALLVGMLKGPSIYNPNRNPGKAKKRRDLVLKILFDESLIQEDNFLEFKKRPLKVMHPTYKSLTRHPAFSDLVTLDLKRNFKDSDLRTKGLKIFTNLDPLIQKLLEESLIQTKKELQVKYGNTLNELEGAAIVIDTFSGEIKAAVGSTEPESYGFNRALNASRPVGSLIKPFIYLSALSKYDSYTLVTPLDDSKLTVPIQGSEVWEPNNFDKEFHGIVPLHKALWQSYNIATARLGLELDHSSIQETFKNLGIEKKVPEYPSVFVGAFEMTPIEVIQAYQTISSGGFFSPLNSVREVRGTKEELSISYPYKLEQRFRPEPIFLLKFILKQTFIRGTARGYSLKLIEKWKVGGKTGTSDDQRDSWFIGYAGEYLALVWLGFDDNRKSPLTGRSGSLQVWKKFISNLDPLTIETRKPSRIIYEWIDLEDGLLSGKKCEGSLEIPFISGTEPKVVPNKRKWCRGKEDSRTSKVVDKIKEMIEIKRQ